MSHVYPIHSAPSMSLMNNGGRAARIAAAVSLKTAVVAFAVIGAAHIAELRLQSFASVDSGERIDAAAPTLDYASADIDRFTYFPEQFTNRGTDLESPIDQF